MNPWSAPSQPVYSGTLSAAALGADGGAVPLPDLLVSIPSIGDNEHPSQIKLGKRVLIRRV